MIETQPPDDAPVSRSPGVPLGAFDVVIRGKGKEVKGRANFFYNHQHLCSVWIELPVDLQGWPAGTELELTAPDVLKPFPVSMRGIHMAMQDGVMTACAVVDPLREPIEASAASALQHVSCAVLDSPISKHGLHKSGGAFKTRCAQFEAVFTLPSDAHSSIANELGSTPHVLCCQSSENVVF